ncbi:MAG: hypothetical protein JOZ72_11665 [Alphaproteobacteria bacterium]|nr:hypothetical protein [Alphaproteobacteria bacterium]
MRRWFLGVAVGVAAFQIAAYPLPEDSTAQNGVMQHKTSHVGRYKVNGPALPQTGLHPNWQRGLQRRYTGAGIDATLYHYDSYPTGWNQAETDLTPATVGSASFGQITTLNVDGNVFAQPLLVSGFTMPDNSVHDVLIVATGHNTVYAYDAQNYSILWKRSLGTPQATNDVGCGDIQPEYGISSTPVIVRTAQNQAAIFVVSASEPAHLSFHTKIHKLDLGTGKDLVRAREIRPQGKLATGGKIHFDPQNQWNRASLQYHDGSIYMGVGSHCDNNAGQISGWMLRYDENLNLTSKFNTIKAQAGYELSSIWMAGYSPAIGPDGRVYAITGNGYYSATKGHLGYGESVLGFTPDLKIDSTFTPAEWQQLNNSDADFGSGGAMLIPKVDGQQAPAMILGSGKSGMVYLLNADNMGGLEGHGGAVLQKVQQGGCWCGAAYYRNSAGFGVVFYQGNSDNLHGYVVNTGATPSLSNTINGNAGGGFGGSFPVVSSNGQTAHTGVVWLIRRASTVQIEAYNAETLGTPLFRSNAGTWSNGSRAYLSPLVANGRVYVPAYQTVTVFGLTD